MRFQGSGSGNSAFGYGSLGLQNNPTVYNFSNATAVGRDALGFNRADNNTAVGYQAGFSNTTGSRSAFFGYQAGYSNTTAFANSAFGDSALYSNTTGAGNNAFGYFALYANTTGVANTAIGGEQFGVVDAAMRFNTTGSYNTAVGVSALKSNTTASNNTAVGFQALYASNATGNTAFGHSAGDSLTSGGFNTMLGYLAGSSATTGTYNTFVGVGSGLNITTGAKNTILGAYDGNQGGLDIRTANNNIVLSDGDGNPRLHYINSVATWRMGNVPTNIDWVSSTSSSDVMPYIYFPTRGDGTTNTSQSGSGIIQYFNDGNGVAPASVNFVRTNGTGGGVSSGSAVTFNATRNTYTPYGAYTNAEVARATGAGVISFANNGFDVAGIEFPATQKASSNANTLDDYERGTWTPSVASTGGATFTYGASTGGTYIKIGRWMYLMGVMNVATKSGGSSGDSLAIILPINAGASDVSGSGVGYHISAATCTNLTVPSGYSGFPQGGVCTPNQASFYPFWTDGANNRILQLGDIANGFQIQFSIAVFTNT
jgi:hypothetical protein